MSSPDNRPLAASPWVWAGLAVLLLFSAVFYIQGPPGLAQESANTYERFRDGGWMSPLTLDQSPVHELSIPYSGWPPLYMTGLCLLSLTGLPFWPAALLYNALLTVLTGVLAVRIARRCGSHWPEGLVFFLAVACPAYGLQFKFAYPVMMVPLCCLVPVAAALAVHGGGISRQRSLMLALGAGLVASLGTWVSFMAAPALFLVFAWMARRLRGTEPGAAALRVVRWSVVLGVCMVAGFILFKLAAAYAFQHEPRLSGQASGGLSKFLERMLPGAKGLVAAAFFWLVRFFWVMLPVAVLMFLLRLKLRSLVQAKPLSVAVTAVLFLIPLLFVCFLPGEIGQSAHIFHGVDFVPLAALLPVLLLPFVPAAALKSGVVWAVFGLLYLQGYRVLPALALENPRAGAAQEWFDAPGDYHYRQEEAALGFRSLVRTSFKNGFHIPASDARAATLDPKAARWQEWLKQGPVWQESLRGRRVALAWTADAAGFSYFVKRPILAVGSFADFEEGLAGLAKLGLLEKAAIILPVTANREPVLQRLSVHGCTAEPAAVPGTDYVLLMVRSEPPR